MSDDRVDYDDPLDLGWFDPDDPFLYDRRLPRGFCTGCGTVAASSKESVHHAFVCDERTYSSTTCGACATENWRRSRCRCCGTEVTR